MVQQNISFGTEHHFHTTIGNSSQERDVLQQSNVGDA